LGLPRGVRQYRRLIGAAVDASDYVVHGGFGEKFFNEREATSELWRNGVGVPVLVSRKRLQSGSAISAKASNVTQQPAEFCRGSGADGIVGAASGDHDEGAGLGFGLDAKAHFSRGRSICKVCNDAARLADDLVGGRLGRVVRQGRTKKFRDGPQRSLR
jgi:hypothetical protein